MENIVFWYLKIFFFVFTNEIVVFEKRVIIQCDCILLLVVNLRYFKAHFCVISIKFIKTVVRKFHSWLPDSVCPYSNEISCDFVTKFCQVVIYQERPDYMGRWSIANLKIFITQDHIFNRKVSSKVHKNN